MKYCFSIAVLCCLLALSSFSGCHKKDDRLTITLYDKPLTVIQANIQGKWKLEYTVGGIACATCLDNRFHNENYTTQFGSDNKIKEMYNTALVSDTTITWNYEPGLGVGNTYVMHYYDIIGYPHQTVVDGIFNDSLKLHDDGIDPVYYHFQNSNNLLK